MVMIDLPPQRRRRPRTIAGVTHALAPGATVLGIEVTQTIQNMNHDVRLIAGKTAVARVYLAPQLINSNVRLRGEIVAARGEGTPGLYVASSNEVMLRAEDHPDLATQRRDAALSLNFLLRLPPAGKVTVRLNRLFAASDGAGFSIVDLDPGVEIEFEAAPVLRIRVLGLRYPGANPPERFAPDPIHFDHLRSYLTRAYPAGGLDWSQAVIDAPPNFAPPFDGTPLPDGSDPRWEALLTLLHQQMMLVRQADMNAGWDPRTHYYGLIADASGFFRGAANDVPAHPAPNTVAVGPCGQPRGGLAWDDDGSYGDWYGAHELAHTFGRFHPGFCGQDDSDTAFPHADGAISDATEDCVGFDVGDPDLNLPMRAYPHEEWVDFMTYCDRQWISRYTYDALHERLIAEDAAFAPPIV
jgi:hypothetical protein